MKTNLFWYRPKVQSFEPHEYKNSALFTFIKPIVFCLFSLFSLLFFNCSTPNQNAEEITYSFFRDVPGVTAEEINAIETFREQGAAFVYGMLESTEFFYNSDGELRGFAVLLCEWLSDFFGVPFLPQTYEWDEMLDGLKNGTIDFTSELTATPARRDIYIMTDAIATRFVSYFRIAGSPSFETITKERPLHLGFLDGATTFFDVLERSSNDNNRNFIPFFVNNYDEAYHLLSTNTIDAFIEEHTAEVAFDSYGNVVVEAIFPLLFGPVSLTTQKTANFPVISIVQKFLAAGGIRHMVELYNRGEEEYKRHKMYLQLSEEERAYIRDNPKIKIVAEHDNYPISFYNEYDKKFQGISFDVLEEIEKLTGLTFEIANNQYDDFAVILKMLEDGEASIFSELIQIPEREGYFLWPQTSVLTDYHAFLSKEEHRNIKINEVMYTRVGLVEGYAQTKLFFRWFPNHAYTKIYDNFIQAYEALERNEIDMIMGSKIMLLLMTNYYELPGFKANLVLDYPYPSTFGLNINEVVLCSIIDKALKIIDTADIESKWTSRTYDYRGKIAQAQRPYFIGAIILLFFILALVLFMFYRSKRYYKIKEESRSKSLFLANMSHEIRTPMNAITGMAEMLLRGNLSDDMRNYVKDIKHAGSNLLSIINDILDISKIEAGKLEIVPVNYQLSSLVNDTVNIIRTRITDKLIWFETNIDKNLPNNLIGDEVRLRQIILNLLSNAAKYTDKGGINFAIEKETTSAGTFCLKITVTDTGKGIKPEDQAKLFDKFVQVDKEKNMGIEGTGLGLAITKQLVDAMGGTISVQSEYGKGSTFTAIIPQGIASEELIEDMEFISRNYDDSAFMVKYSYPTARVLVVDDLPVNLKVVEGLLSPYKIIVETCESGAQALELIKYKKYDMIFLDHMMPDMDGIEAASRIRTWEKDRAAGTEDYRKTPLIALTANAVSGMREKFIENGFDDFLAKPIDVIKLDEMLNRWIDDEKREMEEGHTEQELHDIPETAASMPGAIKNAHTTKTLLSIPKTLLPKRSYKQIVLGLFIVSFGIVLAVSIAANYLISFSMRTMEYNIEQRLVAAAERLAESVSTEELAQYREVEDMQLPSYQALRFKLIEYAQKAEVLYVYFMYPKDGALYYIVDNDFNEETRVGLDSPTDHILEEIPWLVPVMSGKTVYSGLGTYTTGWDGLLSAYAPMFNAEGKVAAVAGVDIEDTVIVQSRRILNFLTIVQIIMVIFVFVTGMYALIRFRKEAKAAEKANAIKDDFLSKMSYELLNPMNTISGMTELALRKELSGEVRELMQEIKKAGMYLTFIINDILDFSEHDSNKTRKLDELIMRHDIKMLTPKEFTIEGIDTAKGIVNTGGDVNKYKQVLKVFAENLKERLPVLEPEPNEQTLPVFTIHIHSIKSSSATIGALEVSALAAELEDAGKTQNFALIKEKHPVFIDQIKKMLYSINSSIDK